MNMQAMQDQLNICDERFEDQDERISKLLADLQQKDQIL